MIKSYRVMLLPNNKQATRMTETANCARYAYNWTLATQYNYFKEHQKYIPEGLIRKLFTEHKQEKMWLYNVSNNATKQAIKDCCDSYLRFLSSKKKNGYKPYNKQQIKHSQIKGYKLTRYDMLHHPKYKKRNRSKPKFYMDCVKIKFTDTHVKLEKLSDSTRHNRTILNWVRLAEPNRIPTDKAYINPRISFDGINWWISVGIETEHHYELPTNNGIGMDVGIAKLAMTSDNIEYRNINKDSKVRELSIRLRRLQRSISRKYNMNKKEESYCKTRNIIKSEYKLLKLNQRLTGIRHNHLHQLTATEIKQKPRFIVTEDLNINGMMRNRYLAKSIQEQCWHELIRQLEYKSNWHGIQFVRANRWYPSSKKCSVCGNIKKDLKLKDRIYKCECGNVLDRDYNAAINLRSYYTA